jgi:hypothetical protein
LNFRKVENVNEMVERTIFGRGAQVDEESEYESEYESEEEMDEQQMAYYQFLQRRAEEEKDFMINYHEIIDELQSCLPDVPERPEVK